LKAAARAGGFAMLNALYIQELLAHISSGSAL
jgi:hypothetical protein